MTQDQAWKHHLEESLRQAQERALLEAGYTKLTCAACNGSGRRSEWTGAPLKIVENRDGSAVDLRARGSTCTTCGGSGVEWFTPEVSKLKAIHSS